MAVLKLNFLVAEEGQGERTGHGVALKGDSGVHHFSGQEGDFTLAVDGVALCMNIMIFDFYVFEFFGKMKLNVIFSVVVPDVNSNFTLENESVDFCGPFTYSDHFFCPFKENFVQFFVLIYINETLCRQYERDMNNIKNYLKL